MDSSHHPSSLRIADRRLLRQSFTSFLMIFLLGLFAYGIYFSQSRQKVSPQILGSESANSPTPTPSPTLIPQPSQPSSI